MVVGDVDLEEPESLRVVLDGAINATVVEGTQGGLSPSFTAAIVNDDYPAA